MEEITAIESYIATHGVYRCRNGEMYYGDENIPLRAQMANAARAAKRRDKRRPPASCWQCGNPVERQRSARPFCSRACFDIARGAKKLALKCTHCGTEFTRDRSRVANPGKTFCNPQCSNAWRKT